MVDWRSVLGTTLSIFLIKIIVASWSLRFSIKAPWPPGRNNNVPSSFLNGVLSLLTAIVSVLGFCSDIEMSYFAWYTSDINGSVFSISLSKRALCSWDTVKCTFTSPFLFIAYWAPSSRCSAREVWISSPILWNCNNAFGKLP